MKKLCAFLLISLFASAAFAQEATDHLVRWRTIVGVITAQNVVNPIANIQSGTFAWSARSGRAAVDLETGAVYFEVEGLVINGTQFSGTAGPITNVVGTVVCSAGARQQVARDTRSVRLSSSGAAHFSGTVTGIPATCANPLFLIRIAVPTGAAGRWIATGADRHMSF